MRCTSGHARGRTQWEGGGPQHADVCGRFSVSRGRSRSIKCAVPLETLARSKARLARDYPAKHDL